MTPRTAEALALLASLPDDVARSLGWWLDESGMPVEPCTREDWHEGLLSGRTNPDGFIRSARIMQRLLSPGGLDALDNVIAGYKRRRFTVIDGRGAG